MMKCIKINLLLAVLMSIPSGTQLLASDSGLVKAAKIVAFGAGAGALYMGAQFTTGSLLKGLSRQSYLRYLKRNVSDGAKWGLGTGGAMAVIAAGSQLSASEICKPLAYSLGGLFGVSRAVGWWKFRDTYARAVTRERLSNEVSDGGLLAIVTRDSRITVEKDVLSVSGVGLFVVATFSVLYTGYQRYTHE